MSLLKVHLGRHKGVFLGARLLAIIWNYSPRIKNQSLPRGWAEVWEEGWKSKSTLILTGSLKGRGGNKGRDFGQWLFKLLKRGDTWVRPYERPKTTGQRPVSLAA
jgi:hypothetical protein